MRGGAFNDFPYTLAASTRFFNQPDVHRENIGFRVASISELIAGLLVMTGMLGIAVLRGRS